MQLEAYHTGLGAVGIEGDERIFKENFTRRMAKEPPSPLPVYPLPAFPSSVELITEGRCWCTLNTMPLRLSLSIEKYLEHLLSFFLSLFSFPTPAPLFCRRVKL